MHQGNALAHKQDLGTNCEAGLQLGRKPSLADNALLVGRSTNLKNKCCRKPLRVFGYYTAETHEGIMKQCVDEGLWSRLNSQTSASDTSLSKASASADSTSHGLEMSEKNHPEPSRQGLYLFT